MMNQVTLLGRLTRDPELRRTGNGTAVTSFSLAIDRDYGNKATGERETDFLNCVAWRNTAEAIAKYFAKGRLILVSGRIQVRSWVDKDGNKRQATEILVSDFYFCDSKKADPAVGQPEAPEQTISTADLPEDDDFPGELPF